LHNWRAREWIPAVDAAGVGKGRRIYDLRHSFATEALAAGVLVYDLARIMGTSVRMIDLTYGHQARGSEDATRALLDARAAARRGRIGEVVKSFGRLLGVAGSAWRAAATPATGRNRSTHAESGGMGDTGLEPVTPSLSSWCSPN
jgi:hypothetical protein